MLGQPVSMLIPRVVGFKLHRRAARRAPPPPTWCSPSPRCCASTAWSASSSSSTAPGVAAVPLANRATIGNMSPEFGSTCAIFPIDDETIALPAPDRPHRRAGRARRGVRQGAGPLARPRRTSRSSPSTSSSTCPPSCPRSPARSARRTASRCRRQGAFRASATTSPTSTSTRPTSFPADPPARRAPTLDATAGRRPTSGHLRRHRRLDHGAVVDRRDHLLHQHLQPVGDARRGPAGQEGRRARA